MAGGVFLVIYDNMRSLNLYQAMLFWYRFFHRWRCEKAANRYQIWILFI